MRWREASGVLTVAVLGLAVVAGGCDEAQKEQPRVSGAGATATAACQADEILCWKGVLLGVAENEQDAAGFARDVLSMSPPLGIHEVSSLAFVKMTVRDGKRLLDPSGRTMWEADGDLRAFFFVARGRFALINRFSETPAPEFGAYCVVVPIGDRGTFQSTCDEDIDLSAFGELHAVPLPLPEFPTPVSLEG